MDDPKVLERMRADWNERAGEDANYYVAFGRREQDEAGFFATGADVVRGLEMDLRRLGGSDAALEIGCGPGRLMRPLARHFREIHGVDVSDGMIELARQRLRGTPNAFPHRTPGAGLSLFPDGKFDFVYSYAVFQHIPSRDVVFQYLREARRVLKEGGILRCQVNGLPATAKQYDTWSGVRIAPDEITRFALEQDFQLLALEMIHTQYMWLTCRKRPAGWVRSLAGRRVEPAAAVRSLCNAHTGEAVAPASGPLAALSLWVYGLDEECDLNHLTISVDERAGRPEYIGVPANDGVRQVNVRLAEGVRTGIVPVEMAWLGQPVCPTAWVRIIPPGPAVARFETVTDGVNLLLHQRTESGLLKVTMMEVPREEEFRATVDGKPVREPDSFCTDPNLRRFEFNFRLPEGVGPGGHVLRLAMGKREFPPIGIEVS
ncbi:MAG TPA: class I SAM-dependent methyltransferase [Bryobacteraceae bacterium]|nr:class I SAM-dependent methyltransferase [Bryobacteraceae bacterium]